MDFEGPDRVTVSAGAAVRRVLRRAFMAAGVDYTEDRGLLDSLFVIDVPEGRILALPDFDEK